jgi:hypothetical protein
MVFNVFFAMSKDAIPPIAFLRCAKYKVEYNIRILIPLALYRNKKANV